MSTIFWGFIGWQLFFGDWLATYFSGFGHLATIFLTSIVDYSDLYLFGHFRLRYNFSFGFGIGSDLGNFVFDSYMIPVGVEGGWRWGV
jgi:hypothetical protein